MTLARRLIGPLLTVALIATALLPGLARPAAAAEAAVLMRDIAFNSRNIQVNVGDTVVWTNDETSVPHDVVAGTPSGADMGQLFQSAILQPGQSFSYTFDQPGEYPYFCSFHPAMTGLVTVVGAPAEPAPSAPQAAPAPQAPAGGPPAQAGPPPQPTNAQVVASGLVNPRGFTWAPDGALVVAETGAPPAGFAPPPPSEMNSPYFQPGTARNGRISRIDPASGERTTIAEGLPTSAGAHGDTIGPVNVAYLGNDLYVLISAGPVHGWPAFPSGVYKVNADGTVRLVANLDEFNLRNPVAVLPPDDEISNPYDMLAADGALWVTDGNRNQVYKVTPDGTVSRVADLSAEHPVTTGLALTPDGALITTELTPVPYPQGAGRVLRIGMDGNVEVLARGTTAATGAAVAPDGTIYVTEMSATIPQPPFLTPFTGRVARLNADGSLTTVAGNLMFPTITRFGPDGSIYVANFSMGSDKGEGQILQVNPQGTP